MTLYLAPIIKTLKEGGLLLIDEVETALHYYAQLLLNLFNNNVTNSKRGQAIITTHNVKLLDEGLRVDQIFTVSKDENGVSVALPLVETDNKSPRKVHKLSERYLEGLYGSVPDVSIEKVKELFV